MYLASLIDVFFSYRTSCIAKNLTVSQPATSVQLVESPLNLNVIYIEMKNQETKYFPYNLGKLFPSLKFVINENSKLENVTNENFVNMINVVDVRLAYNLIQEIPHDTFYALVNLEIIGLNNNKLKHLQKDLFDNNPKLKHVYANDNQIEILEAELFNNNEFLSTIDFDRNFLIAIKTIFVTSKSYDLISFYDNLCIDTSSKVIEFSELFEEIFLKCYGPFYLNPR